MKQKILIILSILSVCLLTFASQGHAYMGTSAGYKLDIADITNSGATGSSAGYSLSAGVTGDNFDGTGESANYHLCAGFAEENYNNTHCGSALPGTLNVIVHVINDDTGTLNAANFTFHVKTAGVDVAGSPAPGVEAPGVAFSLAAGAHTVSVNAAAGYTTAISGSCTAGGAIVLPAGATRTCTITANDITPPPPPPPPPPTCVSGCGGGPGWPPVETQEPQIVIPTQEHTQEKPPVVPPTQEIPNIVIPPYEPPHQPIDLTTPLPEGYGSPEPPLYPSAPEQAPDKPDQFLADVWCAESACFDEPIVILKPAANETSTLTGGGIGQIYIVRPWIIWLTIILLLIIVILLGFYIDAKYQLFNQSKFVKHFPVFKAGRKRK